MAFRFAETSKRTPNVSAGTNSKEGVVFHHTGGAYGGAVSWLMNRASKASAHVVIARDGRRTVLAPDDAITWHAGKSAFKGRSSCNSFMLGVEFALTPAEVQAKTPLSPEQIESCLEWLEERWQKYGWTLDWMVDHRQVALPVGRKADLAPETWAALLDSIRARFVLAKSPATFTDTVTLPEHTIVVPKGTRKIVITIKD